MAAPTSGMQSFKQSLSTEGRPHTAHYAMFTSVNGASLRQDTTNLVVLIYNWRVDVEICLQPFKQLFDQGAELGQSKDRGPVRPCNVAARKFQRELRTECKTRDIAFGCHRIAVEGATPNRTAAEWQLIPASTATKSRVRKPIERG